MRTSASVPLASTEDRPSPKEEIAPRAVIPAGHWLRRGPCGCLGADNSTILVRFRRARLDAQPPGAVDPQLVVAEAQPCRAVPAGAEPCTATALAELHGF